MPIPLTCTKCGEALVAPDDRAGQPIRCFRCDMMLTVPALPPPAPPVVQPVDESPADPTNPFSSFANANDAQQAQERPWNRAHRSKPQRGTPPAWRSFSNGCKWVRYGLLIELLGLGILYTFLALLLLVEERVIDWPWLKNPTGMWSLLLAVPPIFVGSLVVSLGRSLMFGLPRQTGAGGVLAVAMLLSYLRSFLLGVVLVFLVLALLEAGMAARGPYYTWVGRSWVLAAFAGFIAEISIIPGMAIVGGALPSRLLRHRVGVVSCVFQLLAVAWLALFISITYLDAMRDFVPPPARPQNPRPAPAPVDPEVRILIFISVPLVLFSLNAAYTFLHYSLYSAGQRAGATDADRLP